jgi:phospho-N-acetylmuramoyl-pentapeptide-transferase
MLYHWLFPISSSVHVFNIFKYITVRGFLAFVLSALISIIWGKFFIRYMKNRQFGQTIRDDGPQTHKKKSGTPTMGGVFIIGSIIISSIFCGNFSSAPFKVALFVTISYFFLGLRDDYLKILKKNTAGVSAKGKLVWQFGTGLAAGFYLVNNNIISTELFVPFFKEPILDLNYFYILFIAFVIVGTSNAVNLTDGLDGLATGPIITSGASLGFLSYVAGHTELATYLLIPFIDGSGELVILLSALMGASLGFLWYNTYPAEIFMGDVGSLAIGGLLGTVAVLTKNEFLFVIIGGIFVLEAVSVILQVGSFKLRQKRIFKMAPIHHHFELLGWPETKVIVRFWIISICLALIALATLKMR